MRQEVTGPPPCSSTQTGSDQTAEVVCVKGRVKEIATIPVLSLLPGDSPRLEGEDKAHIARLLEVEGPLPPILVDRRCMRVIDGMHRLIAASMKGQETIEVEFFDGSTADAFLRAVEENVTHGLPLAQSDRRAAAERIIASHPHLSDRAIAQVVGLGARTIAGIRSRSTDGEPQLNARVGRDGRVRPLNAAEGRRRAAELIAERPQASLREVARRSGVSLGTARDVRERLERGEGPVPARHGASGRASPQAVPGQAPGPRQATTQATGTGTGTAAVLEKLLRDPSLRHTERGRRLCAGCSTGRSTRRTGPPSSPLCRRIALCSWAASRASMRRCGWISRRSSMIGRG